MGDHSRNRKGVMFCSHCRYSMFCHGGTRVCPRCKQPRDFAFYIPTPEQIKAACLEIQSHWTQEERELHNAYPSPEVDLRAYFGTHN